MRLSVFISYGRRDQTELADRLQRELQDHGFHTWRDQSALTGGTNWTLEIEKAIDESDVLLAIISPASYQSTICRAEQLRALRLEKRVIPILASADSDRPLHLEHLQFLDFSRPESFERDLAELISQISTAASPPLPAHLRHTIDTAPPLPPRFVARVKDLEALRQVVIGERPEVRSSLTALTGMGGTGKTVLAVALCKDPVVHAAFPGGIIWLEVGQPPVDLTDKIRTIGVTLGDSAERYDTLERSINRLRTLLVRKSVLLVLDDVWEHEQVRPFWVDAPLSRILVTTRDRSVAHGLDATHVGLNVLTLSEAKQLLLKWTGPSGVQTERIVRQLGFLPLAIRIAGGRMRAGMTESDWLSGFRAVSRIKLTPQSEGIHDNLAVCFDLSVDQLRSDHQSLFWAFGIYSDCGSIPKEVVVRCWKKLRPQITDFECSELIEHLRNLELVEIDGRVLRMHQLLWDYCREKLKNRAPKIHEALLNSYNPDGHPWSALRDDGYLHDNLAHHLSGAGRLEDLRQLLLDFPWLRTRLQNGDIYRLLRDFDFLGQAVPRLVQSALRDSAHILVRHKSQLAPHLLSRLMGYERAEVRKLLQSIRLSDPWLRPMSPSLGQSSALLQNFLAHEDPIEAIDVTPTNERLVSVSQHGTLKVWRLQEQRLVREWAAHSSPIRTVKLAPGGRRAVSASLDGEIRVWDLEGPNLLHLMKGNDAPVEALAIGRDSRLISASGDGSILIWNMESGVCTGALEGHTGGVEAVVLSPDEKWIVSGSWDRTVRVWDAHSHECLRQLEGHSGAVQALTVDLRSGVVVSGSHDKTLKAWDLRTGRELRRFEGHDSWIASVLFSNDGRQLLSCSGDRTIRLWDFESGEEIQRLEGHTGAVTGICFLSDHRCVSCSHDQTIKVWLLEDKPGSAGSRLLRKDFNRHRGGIEALDLESATDVAASASWDRTIKIWTLRPIQLLHSLSGHSTAAQTVAVRKETAASGGHDGVVIAWDIRRGIELNRVQAHEGLVLGVAFLPDSDCVVSCGDDHKIVIWHFSEKKGALILKGHQLAVRGIAVLDSPTRLLSWSDDSTLRLWELNSGRHSVLGQHLGGIVDVALLNQKGLAFSGSWDQTVRVWDLRTGRLKTTLHGHEGVVQTVAPLADGQTVASGSHDATVRLWDIESGEQMCLFQGHRNAVNRVVAIPNSRLIASCSQDWNVRIWDLDRQSCRASFVAEGPLKVLLPTSDSRMILVGGEGGHLHFLRLENFFD